MKLNTKSRVAIAALLDVAVHGAEKPVTLAGISERQNVSLSYLEQLFRILREQGFVTSSRGPGGGYRLSRQPSAISAADVVNAVDLKSGRMRSCGSSNDCQVGNSCQAHGLWRRVDEHLQDYLRSVTLASILEEFRSPAGTAAKPAVPTFAENQPRRPEDRRIPVAA